MKNYKYRSIKENPTISEYYVLFYPLETIGNHYKVDFYSTERGKWDKLKDITQDIYWTELPKIED